MLEERVHGLIFAIFEEAWLLVIELVDHLSKEVQRVWLVHLISIGANDDVYNALDHVGLGQDLEEALVVAEFRKDR